jgi:hypothetical protein
MSKLRIELNQWRYPRRRQTFDPQKRYAEIRARSEKMRTASPLERGNK